MITLVIGFKNRDLRRVENCLNSLVNQTNSKFQVNFIDYGSEDTIRRKVEKLVIQYPFARYIYTDTRGWVWNRSHALNTGIIFSESSYTVTTDVDLIFPSNFIEELSGNLEADIELHCNAYSLPRNFSKWDSLFDHKPRVEKRDQTALGLVQGVATELLHEIRGFDEFYCIWGVEDEDLNGRLKAKGLETKWLPLEDVSIYHQWHPKSGVRTRSRIPKGWQKYMIRYKDQYQGVLERNDNDSWGILYDESNRPIIEHLNNQKAIPSVEAIGVPAEGILDYLENFMAGDSMMQKYEFVDAHFDQMNQSRLVRWLRKFNEVSNRKNWPILMLNDLEYFGGTSTVYDYRDVIMYFLQRNKATLRDHYLDMTVNKCSIILNK